MLLRFRLTVGSQPYSSSKAFHLLPKTVCYRLMKKELFTMIRQNSTRFFCADLDKTTAVFWLHTGTFLCKGIYYTNQQRCLETQASICSYCN
jgi:hypothetical protein